ncbi:hypothetical protein DIPPA_27418 [Diplonema papillatum]|nr:hypothetical protein DIPPA_27418 [Diplonema papillatum]
MASKVVLNSFTPSGSACCGSGDSFPRTAIILPTIFSGSSRTQPRGFVLCNVSCPVVAHQQQVTAELLQPLHRGWERLSPCYYHHDTYPAVFESYVAFEPTVV